MNTLKRQLDQLAHHLAKLTRPQKLAAGIIVTLIIAAGVTWNQYESATQMQPILDQPLSESEIARITSRLDELRITHRVTSDKKVLVVAERKLEVLADLGYADLLPGNTQGGFDEIIKQMTLWDSSSKTDKMYNRAKEVMLAKVISRFPGVKSVVVLIDPTSESRIGSAVLPSASVSITTYGNLKNLRHLAGGAVNVLSGAQANLERNRIRVTIDGVPCPASDDDLAFAGDMFERKQEIGSALATKVSEHLAIPNVLVSVSVDVGDRTVTQQRHVAPPQPLDEPKWWLALTSPTTGPTVQPEIQMTRTTPGGETITSASVNVPRSYFVNIFKASNPNAREPDDAVLQSIVSSGLNKIRRTVKACLGMKDESLITVDCYADPTPTLAAPQTIIAAPVGWSARIKEIAIGALAVMALLMLSLLVRRNHAAAAPVLVRALPFEHHKQLPNFVDADYFDRDDQEIMTHVSMIVDRNPDRAASLVSRWLDLKR